MTSSACPEVSVVIPTYNVSAFITAAIQSVLHQDFGNFELIVVDDGSSDDTVAVACSFDDPRISVYQREHRGPTCSMNEAVELARGRWIAFLDGDDTWAPAKLRRHIEFMTANPGLDLTFCRSRMIDEHGKNLRISSPRWNGTLSYRQLLVSNPAANGSSIVVSREALLRAGYFDTSFAASYDHELWLRVALLRPHNISSIPENLTFYRRRSGQITAEPSVMEQGWRQLMEKHRLIHPDIVNALESKSCCNLCRYLAAIAYERGEVRPGLQYMRRSLASAPLLFLTTWRSYMVVAALVFKGLIRGLQR